MIEEYAQCTYLISDIVASLWLQHRSQLMISSRCTKIQNQNGRLPIYYPVWKYMRVVLSVNRELIEKLSNGLTKSPDMTSSDPFPYRIQYGRCMKVYTRKCNPCIYNCPLEHLAWVTTHTIYQQLHLLFLWLCVLTSTFNTDWSLTF